MELEYEAAKACMTFVARLADDGIISVDQYEQALAYVPQIVTYDFVTSIIAKILKMDEGGVQWVTAKIGSERQLEEYLQKTNKKEERTENESGDEENTDDPEEEIGIELEEDSEEK